MENSVDLRDGFFKQNMVFMTGMLIAPVTACVTTLSKSALICLVFSIVSPLTILLCRLIPRTIVYTIRVILYSIAAAAFYIPAMLAAQAVFGEQLITSVGVYLPIIITNPLILSKSETRFYHEPVKRMIPDVIAFVLGFDGACLITGFIRELFADGRIAGVEVGVPFTIPALETTFGGFLLVGIGAGLFRALYNYRKNAALRAASESEESLAEYAEDVGEFLIGHGKQPEKIKIYRTAAKKARSENELLELEFLSNKDVLAAFEAIVAEGSELSSDGSEEPDEAPDNEADGETAEKTEAKDGETV